MSARRRWSGALASAARLGLAPDAFWRLSVAEWRALSAPGIAEPLSRAELDALMRAHPDK